MSGPTPAPAAPTEAGAERLAALLRLPGGCAVSWRGPGYVVATHGPMPRPPVTRWLGAPVGYRIGTAAPLGLRPPQRAPQAAGDAPATRDAPAGRPGRFYDTEAE